jgi:hypothetical protein
MQSLHTTTLYVNSLVCTKANLEQQQKQDTPDRLRYFNVFPIFRKVILCIDAETTPKKFFPRFAFFKFK